MNKTKKLLFISMVLIFGSVVFAEEIETGISFSNEFGSDNFITINKENASFNGFYDEVVVDATSKYIDAGIDTTLNLSVNENGNLEGFSWDDDSFDWYVTVKPFEVFSVGFSSDFYFSGSYLAVEDDNIAGGNLGGNGITLVYTGMHNLTLATSFGSDTDDVNWFYHKENDSTVYFDDSFGCEYTFDNSGSLGAVVHNVANSADRGFGVYASFSGIEGLELDGGYAYNDQEGICDINGDQLLNFSFIFEKNKFNCAADYVTNNEKQFYSGLTAGYNITEAINTSVTGTLNSEYDSVSDGTLCLTPAVTYTNNSFGSFIISTAVTLSDGQFDSICFPVYWDYSF